MQPFLGVSVNTGLKNGLPLLSFQGALELCSLPKTIQAGSSPRRLAQLFPENIFAERRQIIDSIC